MSGPWLHLDLKGIAPASVPAFCRWLDYFRALGFERILLEYDCRVDWETWPRAAIPLYSKKEIAAIDAHAKAIGLRIVPLIQSLGHLEWALKHEFNASLRENGKLGELCPNHPGAAERIEHWIDEVLAMHPDTDFLHLGADETWALATCPVCRAEAEKDPADGKLGVYVKHIARLCRYAVSKGVRPMIWADMFLRENRCDLAGRLPPETVLVDWNYHLTGQPKTNAALSASGHGIMGASALQCWSPTAFFDPLPEYSERFANIAYWNASGLPAIHTTWGRPGNLLPLYSPWFGLIPLFAAAANSDHPWKKYFDSVLAPALRERKGILPGPENAGLAANGPIEEQALRYLSLAAEYHELTRNLVMYDWGRQVMRVTDSYVTVDPAVYRNSYDQPARDLQPRVSAWADKIRAFFRDNELSDADEFIAERLAIFANLFKDPAVQP